MKFNQIVATAAIVALVIVTSNTKPTSITHLGQSTNYGGNSFIENRK